MRTTIGKKKRATNSETRSMNKGPIQRRGGGKQKSNHTSNHKTPEQRERKERREWGLSQKPPGKKTK